MPAVGGVLCVVWSLCTVLRVQVLHLRAESAALREELVSCRRQSAAQLTELSDKVTALTRVNTQLERAAQPEQSADP